MRKKYDKNESIINIETLKTQYTPNYMEEDVFQYDEELLDYLNASDLNPDSESHNQHFSITIKTSTADLSIDLSDVVTKSITLKIEV